MEDGGVPLLFLQRSEVSTVHYPSRSIYLSFSCKNQLFLYSIGDNQDCLETLKLATAQAEEQEKTRF